MQDLILGAIIGFLPSFITLIVTSIIQWKRETKAREWHLEDRSDDQLKQAIYARAEELETFSKEIMALMGSISLELNATIRHADRDDLLEYMTKINQQIGDLVSRMPYYSGIAIYFRFAHDYGEFSDSISRRV